MTLTSSRVAVVKPCDVHLLGSAHALHPSPSFLSLLFAELLDRSDFISSVAALGFMTSLPGSSFFSCPHVCHSCVVLVWNIDGVLPK